MTNKTTLQMQGSNISLRNFLSLGNSTGDRELLNKVHTKETKYGYELARRLLRTLDDGRDSVSASPPILSATGKIFISCGRKFKSLLGKVVLGAHAISGLVTLRELMLLLILVLLVSTIWLTVRWLCNRQKRVEARIAMVIQRSEANLVLHTEARIRYSTEYTHLTSIKIEKLFEQGCISIRKDASGVVSSKKKDTSGVDPSGIAAPLEFTRKQWTAWLKGTDECIAASTASGSAGPSAQSQGALKGTWHALWNEPPRVDAGLWDIQGKTQKVSYDAIYLGRDSNRKKIWYNSATDYGLCSSWVQFFYEVNDDIPNFLRHWQKQKLFASMEQVLSYLVPHHQLMTPPDSIFPLLVPCPQHYRMLYSKLHRIKLISDKITTTMRTDGNWNENVFLTTYRNLISGNSQTSMGHKLSDPAMIDYLPLIRKRVRDSRATIGTSEA